jgi:hypothetical protein
MTGALVTLLALTLVVSAITCLLRPWMSGGASRR